MWPIHKKTKSYDVAENRNHIIWVYRLRKCDVKWRMVGHRLVLHCSITWTLCWHHNKKNAGRTNTCLALHWFCSTKVVCSWITHRDWPAPGDSCVIRTPVFAPSLRLEESVLWWVSLVVAASTCAYAGSDATLPVSAAETYEYNDMTPIYTER